MIENLQEKLHQGKHKKSKVAQICASIRWDLECEKYSNNFLQNIWITKYLKSK